MHIIVIVVWISGLIAWGLRIFGMWLDDLAHHFFRSSNEMPLFEELRYIIDWGLLSLPFYKLENHGNIVATVSVFLSCSSRLFGHHKKNLQFLPKNLGWLHIHAPWSFFVFSLGTYCLPHKDSLFGSLSIRSIQVHT